MVTRIAESPKAVAQEREDIHHVTSKDGTTIGYRQLGQGPGVVLLHGAASSGYNHVQLAEALADIFTVYVPDRRGRGLSGPFGNDYGIHKEVEDLEALLIQTGAQRVFAVSAGAIILLEAARILPSIRRAAICEPPLALTLSAATSVLNQFDREMAEGRLASALVIAMKGAQMGPAIFNVIPGRVLEMLVNMALKGEDKNGSGGYVSMRQLAQTMHYDFQLVVEMIGKLETFREIPAEVLLLGGSKSPAYFKDSLAALERVLPHYTRVELPGLGHAASWNADRGGKPDQVARELRRFFA